MVRIRRPNKLINPREFLERPELNRSAIPPAILYGRTDQYEIYRNGVLKTVRIIENGDE